MELVRWLCDVPFSLSIYLSSILKVIVIVRGIHCTHRKSGFHRTFTQVVRQGRGDWDRRRCSRPLVFSLIKSPYSLRSTFTRLSLRNDSRSRANSPKNRQNQALGSSTNSTGSRKISRKSTGTPSISSDLGAPKQRCPSDLKADHHKILHQIGRFLPGFGSVLRFARFDAFRSG